MAESPSHTFGQQIGEILEVAVYKLLRDFAIRHHLYLDKKGPRPARPGNKLTWMDSYGNTHDLDYVLEKGGTETTIGTPFAFIEVAWRRYTKHSRNKAQEIQGAILPLVDRNGICAPFAGVILGGEFTEGSLTQLESLKFRILHFPYDSIVEAFGQEGVDASFNEHTPDDDFLPKLTALERLGDAGKKRIAANLLTLNHEKVDVFMESLDKCASRAIDRITILPLFGEMMSFMDVNTAIASIEEFIDGGCGSGVLVRYEIEIIFNNGDSIKAQFGEKQRAIEFLREYQPTVAVSAIRQNNRP